MTYYTDLEFSDSQVAGAVTETALHDLRVNNFGFPGFPQVDVSCAPDDSFTVVISWEKTASVQFHLSKAEAKSAAKKFTSGAGYDPAIFKKVQGALIELEGKASRYPTS
jgi:hypothetical protein